MSTLGDEIRTQQALASRMSADLAGTATTLRSRVASADWVSRAADHCRVTLEGFARRIDGARDDAGELARAIGQHASSVESHESILTRVLGLDGTPHDTTRRDISAGWR